MDNLGARFVEHCRSCRQCDLDLPDTSTLGEKSGCAAGRAIRYEERREVLVAAACEAEEVVGIQELDGG